MTHPGFTLALTELTELSVLVVSARIKFDRVRKRTKGVQRATGLTALTELWRYKAAPTSA